MSKNCCWNFVQGYWKYPPMYLVLKKISLEHSDLKKVKKLLRKWLVIESLSCTSSQVLWPSGSWMYQRSDLPYKSFIILFSTECRICSWKTTAVGDVLYLLPLHFVSTNHTPLAIQETDYSAPKWKTISQKIYVVRPAILVVIIHTFNYK